MGDLLIGIGPDAPGSQRGGLESVPTAWWVEPVRWIDERLALLEAGDPRVDLIRLGQPIDEGSTAWAEIYSLVVVPRVRATKDGDSDQADLQLVVTCMAGQHEMRADPFACIRLAGLVWALLDEYKRSETAATELGAARHVSLYLGRARIEEQNPSGQRATRLPAVVCEAGRITTGPVRATA